MPTCFIIMPITTAEQMIGQYGNDKQHFIHVLEHLFVPAIEKATFSAILPIASGADLIHAEIIRNLESSDLVLCDMSSLNANVFFELGIRTAVDRPVCLVTDTCTSKIPFDTGLLNYHTYDATLAPWTLFNEITALVEHITKSVNSSKGRNTLWRHFGLTTRAELVPPESPVEEKLNLILDRLADMDKRTMRELAARPTLEAPQADRVRWFITRANEIASRVSARRAALTGAVEEQAPKGRCLLKPHPLGILAAQGYQ